MHFDIHIHPLALLVAAVATYALAALWYGVIFAKPWQRLTGITDMKPSIGNVVLVFVATLVMAFVLYHSIVFGDAFFEAHGAPMSRVAGGLMGGFFGWLGYVAPVTLCTKLYEKKPWGLWLLDNGFWLVALLVMGTILSLWM